MNGAHDLGGMHGWGPITPEPEGEAPVFHATWEKRLFGLSLAVGALGTWNIDMWRQASERQHPVEYLRHTYYQNWLVGLATLLVETGLVTAEELATGKAIGPTDDATRQRVLKAEQVSTLLGKGAPVTMASDTAPRFQPGDRVRAINRHPLGHTRGPRYVRGRMGVIREYHGTHVFPDRNAAGSREGQPLYSVRFEASALWGENASAGSAVYVDLWEGYLEPAG